jgi:anthranilate synthase component 1
MQTSKPALELLTSDAIYRENPTALFHQLCGARPATLLLESADIDSKDDLKSLLLVDSALRITALGDTVTIQALANGARCWNCWTARCPPGSPISASPTAGS